MKIDTRPLWQKCEAKKFCSGVVPLASSARNTFCFPYSLPSQASEKQLFIRESKGKSRYVHSSHSICSDIITCCAFLAVKMMGSDARDVMGLPSAGPPKSTPAKVHKSKGRGPSKITTMKLVEWLLTSFSWNKQGSPRPQIRRSTSNFNCGSEVQREAQVTIQTSSVGRNTIPKFRPYRRPCSQTLEEKRRRG